MPETTRVSPSSTCARPANRSPAAAGRAAASKPMPPAPSGSRRAVAALRWLLAYLQGRQLDLIVYDLGHHGAGLVGVVGLRHRQRLWISVAGTPMSRALI